MKIQGEFCLARKTTEGELRQLKSKNEKVKMEAAPRGRI